MVIERYVHNFSDVIKRSLFVYLLIKLVRNVANLPQFIPNLYLREVNTNASTVKVMTEFHTRYLSDVMLLLMLMLLLLMLLLLFMLLLLLCI